MFWWLAGAPAQQAALEEIDRGAMVGVRVAIRVVNMMSNRHSHSGRSRIGVGVGGMNTKISRTRLYVHKNTGTQVQVCGSDSAFVAAPYIPIHPHILPYIPIYPVYPRIFPIMVCNDSWI